MTMMVSRRDAGMLCWQNLLPKAGRGVGLQGTDSRRFFINLTY
jgi:hypothetical protein